MIRKVLKTIKLQIRKIYLFDKLYLFIRYGKRDPFSTEYWDSIWKKEGNKTWRKYPELYDSIVSLIPRGKKILDIGSGIGVLLKRIRKEKNCEVYGVDLSFYAVGILKENHILGVVNKMPELSIKENSFDVVIATEFIEHVKELNDSIESMISALKVGGTLIISTPNDRLSPADCDEHVRTFNKKKLESIVKNFLMKGEVIITNESNSHLILVAEKLKNR
jgi:2-polyprenyl-3-methyl-5-hydroxy-6-metoxy-1,4-benzoquinol methylase